jgi:hypothetical protein
MRIADVFSRALALCRFDLLFRKNPFGGEYTVFAGLEECVRFAANFKFMDEDIDYLRSILPPTCEVRLLFLSPECLLLSNFVQSSANSACCELLVQWCNAWVTHFLSTSPAIWVEL